MTRSGADIGAENVERLRTYLAGLEATGTPLPMRNGRPNMSAIALACRFDRQVLYKNPAAAALIGEAEIRLPADTTSPPDEQNDEKPRSDRRDSRIMQLEQQLAAARAENAGLRERLRRLQHIEDHVAETGRRIANVPPSFGGTGK